MIAAVLLAAAASTVDHVYPDCRQVEPDEVVVCGSRDRQSPYRLPKISDEYAASDRALRAETTIAGMKAKAHVVSVDLPGGAQSNRLMITISTGF